MKRSINKPVARHFKYTAIAVAAVAVVQMAAAQEAKPQETSNELVVTGFRAALAGALSKKKEESGVVDVIKAEDIGKFPDSNLAESLQRVPGVAIDREGGEGRTISVRGLNPEFTRVRINGMEALASWGNQDGPSRSRGFDFNIFASELFSEIMVRKTASADVDEGSLGATVDLRAARPFDFKAKNGPVAMVSSKAVYNSGSGATTPRASFLFSKTNEDKTVGFLLSGAYSKSKTLDAGFDTVRWADPKNVNSGTGFANDGGTGANTVSTTDFSQNKYSPRFPRYGQFDNEQDRMGLTASLQVRPSQNTTVSLDMLYSKVDATRKENWLEAISFSRAGAAGLGGTSIVPGSALFDSKNNLVKGTFNGVDIRTESRLDELSSTFSQPTLNLEHYFNDDLKLNASLGRATNKYRNPVQVTTSLDAYNVQGYTIDFSGDNRRPAIGYGNLDVTKFGTNNICTSGVPCALGFSSSASNGDASLLRMRQMNVDNTIDNASVDLTWDLNPGKTKIMGGLSRKVFGYKSTEFRRTNTTAGSNYGKDNDVIPSIPGADYATMFSGFGTGLGMPAGTPTAWLVPNYDALKTLWNFDGQSLESLNNTSARGANTEVKETDNGIYGMLDFKEKVHGMPVRGNVGVRYVKTNQTVTGYAAKVGSEYPAYTVNNSYSDVLPSLNLALTPVQDVVIRAAAAKVMARPGLSSLNPGGSLSTDTLTSGNPFLKPMRAKSFDLGAEYYFGRNALIGVGVFQKDIESYIQTLVTQSTWANLGLDPAKYGSTAQATDTVYAKAPVNTPGGKLKGIELNYQQPFSFLDGIGKNFGSLISYTAVNSKMRYVTNAGSKASDGSVTGTTYVVDDLLGMSPTTWAATLYYEDAALSGRVSVTNRSGMVTIINPGNNNDIQGRNSFQTLDASLAYKWDKQLTLTLEGVNLTNARNDTFIGRDRDNVLRNTQTGRIVMAGARYSF
jgi:TonB-dependent receptor